MFGGELDFRVQTETQWGYPLHLPNALCAFSLPLSLFLPSPPSLSSVPQMEVSGMGCVLFLQITFIESGGGEGVGRLWCGCGATEQISPELSAISENIIPSASPSCFPTTLFYRHLKTHKSAMIHQTRLFHLLVYLTVRHHRLCFDSISVSWAAFSLSVA